MSVHTNIDMTSSNRTVEGFIKLGNRTTNLISFNDHTTIVDVNCYIREWFNEFLPRAFHIEFYSDKKNIFLHLDEKLMESELNPFRFDANSSTHEIASIMDYVQLFIVEDSSPDDQINPLPNTVISSGELDDALFDTILSGDIDNALLLSPFVPGFLNDTAMFHNNIATNDPGEEEEVDEEIITDHSAVEDSQISTTSSSNEYQLATQTIDENNPSSTRLLFSHDVQPEQKHHYLSNKYNIDNGADESGGISYIQGVKTKEETKKKTQVLPHLLIPQLYRFMENINLVIYAVYEEQENGMRIWYKNPHKGFLLPQQLNPEAEFFNPIKLVLNKTQWKPNGDYTLEIYMLTKLNKKSRNKEEVYRLDEKTTIQMHKAKHILSSKRKHLKPTRLLCVLGNNNTIDPNTVGLSDFIQPHTKNHPRIAFHGGNSTVQITPPPPKKQKV